MEPQSNQRTPAETNPAAELRKVYRVTVFIGLAVMASLVIYVVIVEFIKTQHDSFTGYAPIAADVFTVLRFAFLAVAAAEFFAIQIITKVMLSAKAASLRNVTTPAPFNQLMSAAIVTFALCESVAIYGIVLFFIRGSSSDFYLFLMISVLYFTIHFPRYGKWEEWVRERETRR